KNVKAQIWDTAGQERFRAITSAYYRGAIGALLVYDVTRLQSFENIKKWLSELRSYADNDIVITLVGNKRDLQNLRKVSREEAENFAKIENLNFFETSALEDANIEEAFQKTVRDIHTTASTKHIEERPNFLESPSLAPSQASKKPSCC
ncbi:hypothetical protein Zmor_008702, partial [Zophobas morio]